LTKNVEEEQARVYATWASVGGDKTILAKLPPEISFTQAKKVSLVRFLVLHPEYLLFDEPTTGQDPIATRAINERIEALAREQKLTCVVVSHDMKSALRLADRILVLDGGKILDEGTPAQLKKSPQDLTRAFLEGVGA